jgi:transcriptional regulator with XRE-family HTH domain
MAKVLGVSPTLISRVEQEQIPPPGEETILRWATALNENPDVLLAMAGKVSSRLQRVILRRPKLFSELLEQLDEMPDHAVLRVAREVRDGKW